VIHQLDNKRGHRSPAFPYEGIDTAGKILRYKRFCSPAVRRTTQLTEKLSINRP
jgi:hypothetical protein